MGAQPHVNELVEHLFRHQAGQMLATLTHILGLENLDLAEEVVQEALLQALRQWPFHGVPDHPRAWLVRTAHHKALDLLRRRVSLRRKAHELEQRLRIGKRGLISEPAGRRGARRRAACDDLHVL